MIGAGVLAAGIGIVAMIWPGITVGAFVVLFAVNALVAAAGEAMTAFRRRTFGPVIGHLTLAVLDVAAAGAAIAVPGITVLVMVYVVAAWALLGGLVEVAMAFAMRVAPAGHRTWVGLRGGLGIALAVVLFAHPLAGSFALASVFGFLALIAGATAIAARAELRRAAKDVESDDRSAEHV